jgi:hypothetical protein
LRIKDFLSEDYHPNIGKTIFLTIGEVNNPTSTFQVDGLKITVAAEGLYAIDEYEGPIPWSLVTGIFTFMQVDPGSSVAYRSENTYSIKFKPEHKIPQNGYITVWFPIEVTIPDFSFSQSSCSAVESSGFPSSQINCEFTQPTSSVATHYSLRILNAFRRNEGQANVDYIILVPGIRNPIQTIATGRFIFETFNKLS